MTVESVIKELREATAPARALDISIAEAIGWTKKVELVKDKTGQQKPTTLWLVPNSNDVGKIPLWTTNLHHAYEFAQNISSASIGGCTWEEGRGSARLGSDAYVEACNPQIALCLAALIAMKDARDQDE